MFPVYYVRRSRILHCFPKDGVEPANGRERAFVKRHVAARDVRGLTVGEPGECAARIDLPSRRNNDPRSTNIASECRYFAAGTSFGPFLDSTKPFHVYYLYVRVLANLSKKVKNLFAMLQGSFRQVCRPGSV